jgi:hypothetical protein
MSRPAIAALLSFLIPGVGQIYNREVLRGLFWLIVPPALWIGSAGFFGWVVHLSPAATAYHRAEQVLPRRIEPGWTGVRSSWWATGGSSRRSSAPGTPEHARS